MPTTIVLGGDDLDAAKRPPDPAAFSPPGFRQTNSITHSCKIRPAVDAYRTYPDPRDIRRRGGVARDGSDLVRNAPFRKAYFEGAFAGARTPKAAKTVVDHAPSSRPFAAPCADGPAPAPWGSCEDALVNATCASPQLAGKCCWTCHGCAAGCGRRRRGRR